MIGFICVNLFITKSLLSAETIHITNGEYSPYTSEQLKNYGIWSHIVTEAFAQEGIIVEYSFFPWKRALIMAQEGERDAAIGFSKTPERLKSLRFPKTPIGSGSVVFYHRKDYSFNWKTVDDLQGPVIGLMFGYAATEEFETLKRKGKKLKLEVTTNEVQNFKKLLAGRIDLFPAVKVVADRVLYDNFTPEEIEALTTNSHLWKEKNMYVAFSGKNMKTEKFIRAFENGMKKLKQNGRYEQMIEDFKNGKYNRN